MKTDFLPTVDKLRDVTGARLFDHLQQHYKLKNDRQLALALGYAPSQICKMRSGYIGITPSLILRVHDFTGLPASAIRAIARGD